MTRLDCLENLWMREIHALRPTRRRRRIEAIVGSFRKHCAAAVDFADTKLGSLQIGEDADRPLEARLRRPHRRVQFFHGVEGGMAHVDAEHVHPCLEQTFDHLRRVRRGPERGDDLGAPTAFHLGLAPPSLGSVRRMVQSLASWVSTSKKPVLLKPRRWQS